MSEPDHLAFALAYAERGWPTFPLWGVVDGACGCGHECHSAGKHPHKMAPHGFKHATVDCDRITTWWTRDPSANIAIACGAPGPDVLDVDHTDFATGVGDLVDEPIELYAPQVVTASGRYHVYFAPSGLRRRIRVSAHCDWLGEGGYVVAPPSLGVSGERYRWVPSPRVVAPPEVPEALRAVVDPPASPMRAPRPSAGRSGAQSRSWTARGLVDRMRGAVEGERNEILHWCACRVADDVAAGEVPADVGRAALEQLIVAATSVGLSELEAERTVRAVMRRSA